MKTEKINNKLYSVYDIKQDYKNVYYFLKENHFSENFISNLRKNKNFILVNDGIATTRTILKTGDTLKICSNPNAKTSIMQCVIPLDIVYEDDFYLIVNKPSGLACMPTQKHYTNNLAGAICNYMQSKDSDFTLRIINRLDKDTSGLILVAKNSIAQKEVKNFSKTYYAICCGLINEDLKINRPILTLRENGTNLQKRIISEKGQPAITHIHPIKTIKNNYTLLQINLQYGRTHQIRVHLSSIGHPLLGDQLYGEFSSQIEHSALVCKEISFFNPYIKKEMSFDIPFPKDFANLLQL